MEILTVMEWILRILWSDRHDFHGKCLVVLLMEEIRLTSWYDKYPIIYKVLYIPGGARFLPLTVGNTTLVPQPTCFSKGRIHGKSSNPRSIILRVLWLKPGPKTDYRKTTPMKWVDVSPIKIGDVPIVMLVFGVVIFQDVLTRCFRYPAEKSQLFFL